MADQPDRVWTADITYTPTWSGWPYLAVVLNSTELVIDALDEQLLLLQQGGVATTP